MQIDHFCLTKNIFNKMSKITEQKKCFHIVIQKIQKCSIHTEKERHKEVKPFIDEPQSFWDNVLWTDGITVVLYGNEELWFVYKW